MAERAEVDPLDRSAAGGVKLLLGRAPEVEAPLAHGGGAETPAEGHGDVFAHLVAAGTDPGTDRSGQRAAAESPSGRPDDAREQAAPAHVHERQGRWGAACARDR